MNKPVVGEVYAKRGFLFRIDWVSETEVYVSKMKEGGELLVPMRVTFAVWDKEMADAVLSEAKVPA